MKDFYGRCGCNCGRCPAFIKNAKTDEDRQRCSDGWYKVLGVRLKPEVIHCNGCRSTKPRQKGEILPDTGCYIRPCATFLEIDSCAQCYAYPCEDLQRRMPGGDFRELIEGRIKEPLSEEEYHSFVEPYEALKNLEEIRASLSLDEIIDKKDIPPIKAIITDFPEELPFSKNEVNALKSVHKLLTNVVSPRAETYARQLMMKRRRKDNFGLLWVAGLYGERSKDGFKLVLDSRKGGTQRPFLWLVRKRDTALHETSLQSLGILHNYGVRHRYKTLEKEWVLELSFIKKTGGSAALKTLKKYTERLTEEYGEPQYTGAAKFKGKAFTLFKRADMRVLAES